ncbi:hypothetical protein EJ04DRAFT_605737 [Polyplosphaeria fusca]|uniref:Uncharacterized protein n=1 Tax=Polyplosphaeria fusca TaxID=682080 RepID=A0A9P4QT39_9PLEO|nr:hypothetical protein EJ04DRAFT_605737 [Polyplosphaeria fusca]
MAEPNAPELSDDPPGPSEPVYGITYTLSKYPQPAMKERLRKISGDEAVETGITQDHIDKWFEGLGKPNYFLVTLLNRGDLLGDWTGRHKTTSAYMSHEGKFFKERGYILRLMGTEVQSMSEDLFTFLSRMVDVPGSANDWHYIPEHFFCSRILHMMEHAGKFVLHDKDVHGYEIFQARVLKEALKEFDKLA